MSFKNRLTAVQKQLNNITTNIKTYQIEVQNLRQTKEAFEKAFNSKNTDVKRNLTTELQRIHQQLKRHLAHHRNQNTRIQQQLTQLNEQKQNFQGFLKTIRQKLEDIQRQVGQ